MQVSSKTAGWIVFVLLAVYYILNRFPGPAFIDSGELALASYTLGVPHPTGYPLYVILTAPFAHLFHRPITGVTIMAGILTALAGLAFFHLTALFKRRYFPESDQHQILSVVATLILFMAPVTAAQGMTNEVYGLALLVNLGVVLAAMRLIYTTDKNTTARFLLLACYLTGLSLTNHMSSIQLLPGLVFITIIAIRRAFSLKLLLIAGMAFALPITIYLTLPLRAAADPAPVASWGDVTSWENFIRHASGWQFQAWMFTGKIAEIWRNFTGFGSIIYDQFPVAILPLAAVGIYFLARRALPLLIFLALIMTVNIGLGINYSIPDIDSYYLLTISGLMLMAFAGLIYIHSLIRFKWLMPGVAAILLIWQGTAVWDENYKGDYTLPEDYALNIGRSADYGSVILSEIWDHHGQAFYLQQAEGIRPDLRFIDKELLRRSWYYKTIQNTYPDLYEKIADLAAPFLDNIRVFETGGDFDAATLEFYYQAIINRLLTECGPAYIDYRLTYKPHGDQYLRPQGVLYRVDTVRILDPLPQPELIWRGRGIDKYTDRRALIHVEMIKSMASYW